MRNLEEFLKPLPGSNFWMAPLVELKTSGQDVIVLERRKCIEFMRCIIL